MKDQLLQLKLNSLISGIDICDFENIENILKNRFKNREETEIILDMVNKKLSQQISVPINNIELFLTDACNMRCSYCFVVEKDIKGAMPEDTGRAAIDLLMKQSGKITNVNVGFLGGEPLLLFQRIRSIVLYAEKSARIHNKKIAFNLTTNGTLINENMMQFLSVHAVAVLISIDGGKASNNKYRKLVNEGDPYDIIASIVPLAKQYQPWLGARMTIHPSETSNLFNNIMELKTMGFNQILFEPATGTGWDHGGFWNFKREVIKLLDFYYKYKKNDFRITYIEELERKLTDPQHWGCRAGTGSLAVSPKGFLYPCSRFIGLPNAKEKYSFGHVNAKTINNLKRIKYIVRDVCLDSKCKKCSYATICNGGCYPVNLEETRDILKCSAYQRNLMKTEQGILKYFTELMSHLNIQP